MRKDVRMGFGVGGVLLAVIIVAILVIHRNRNHTKAVVLDSGKNSVSPANDPITVDPTVTSAPDGSVQPAAPAPASDRDAVASTQSPKSSSTDADDKAGSRWDALFASSAQDPVKAQLTSTQSKTEQSAELTQRAPEGRVEAVSNSQITTGPAPDATASVAPAVEPVTHTATDAPRTHKVQQGETFSSIAKAVYGSSRYYNAIQEANPTVSAQRLRPGMVIQLPPASQVKQSAKPSKPAAAAPADAGASMGGKTYTVQKDDNLYKISRKLYGRGDKGEELYTLNRQVIGPDSTKLKIGMVLRLPEAPTATASR